MISIIIPCFNIEQNIDTLISMYKNDCYEDFEVLFVDDCSKDHTYDLLLEKCAGVHNFVVLKTNQNGGPGAARNMGLENAKGEHIVFCDSDDEFDIIAFVRLCEKLKQDDIDMVVCPHFIKNQKKRKWSDPYISYKEGEIVCGNDVARDSGHPWSRIFKKKIIQENNIRFPLRMFGEDKCFVVEYVVHAKKIVKSNICYYTYVVNSKSLMHNADKKELNAPTTFEILFPLYHSHFPTIEEEMFINDHLLAKAKQMTRAKCNCHIMREWFANENKRYPNWIDRIDFKKQSLYRRMIYKAMYYNNIRKIKFLMFVRRVLL